MVKNNGLPAKNKNFAAWYNEVILKSGLADYAPIKGCMVIKPLGYALWENIQRVFNQMIKEEGVENAYFPLFIPQSFLHREKEHVAGFSPQLAVVTVGGGKKLAEPLVVRPTSETIICRMFANWVTSWRDLPLKINQWCNVVRWELRTYLFLRTTEFLWQEGHTAHATEKEAILMAQKALNWYQQLYEDYYAMAPVVGEKSESEKFAGAKTTWSVEFLMPDGKALQGATSHHLAQNFARPFEIVFQDQQGKTQYVWQTSWGLTTRSIGGLVMTHGDDCGLVLPPKLAPYKVALIPIFGEKDQAILALCQKIKKLIEDKPSQYPGKVKIFADSQKSFGWRISEAELQGIPLLIAVGEKELKENFVKPVFRVKSFASSLINLPINNQLVNHVEELLQDLQNHLLQKSRQLVKEQTYPIEGYSDFKKIMATKRGFLSAFWCGNPACETAIKKETKATTRVLPLNSKEEKGVCVYCGQSARQRWFFAQAY